MNPVSVGEYHGLRVGSALLSIVAGCIIIGVSRECDADAVGGIFLGAGGLGECAGNDLGVFIKIVAGFESLIMMPSILLSASVPSAAKPQHNMMLIEQMNLAPSGIWKLSPMNRTCGGLHFSSCCLG